MIHVGFFFLPKSYAIFMGNLKQVKSEQTLVKPGVFVILSTRQGFGSQQEVKIN